MVRSIAEEKIIKILTREKILKKQISSLKGCILFMPKEKKG